MTLTRRRLLAGMAAGGLLAGCGTGPTSAAPAEPEGWSFTDDRGVAVRLPGRPSRIAAYDATGAALIALGVRPVAIFGHEALDQKDVLTGRDLTGVESAGETYGEVDVEQLLELGVDLVVTAYDPTQDGPIFGFVDGPVQGQVESVAPIVAFSGIEDPAAVIGRFEELGADLDAPAVVADRMRFEQAREGLRAATAARPDLLAVALSVFDSNIYFKRPATSPATRQFTELGLNMVEPEGEPADINEDFQGYFSDIVSLELGGQYPADLVLLDRTEPEVVAGIATLAALPAVQAGQLVEYSDLIHWTYPRQGAELEALAAAVRSANPALV